MTALHCVDSLGNNFENFIEMFGIENPLDMLFVVGGAYYSRNFTLHSNSEPEYIFQVSITILFNISLLGSGFECPKEEALLLTMVSYLKK